MKFDRTLNTKNFFIGIIIISTIFFYSILKAQVRSRPQEPKRPFPYNEEEVFYVNEIDEIKLSGTLTYPKNKGLFPAVILITGQGCQNRDEEILGHRPFLVLSDYLTRRGIAVLRSDDRGVGKSEGSFYGATTKDFATDVIAAFKFLQTRVEINSKKIGLIGHSEGGVIAPIVAVVIQDIAFIVMMAGPALSGEEIMYQQFLDIAKANGVKLEMIKKQRQFLDHMMIILRKEPNNDLAREEILNAYKKFLSELTSNEINIWCKSFNFNDPKVFSSKFVDPWCRYILLYDPLPNIMKVKCPVLAIFGENDLQVPAIRNSTVLEHALKKGRNKNYLVEILPDLNHLFQTAITGSPLEYEHISETIAPIALQTIGDWILKQISD